MIRAVLLLVLLGFGPAEALAGGAEERPKYCEEPVYAIRGEPEKHRNPGDEDVLNPEEQADPAKARQLAAAPGPYGHSELGFRYLARVLGYPGRFGRKEDVENWIMQEEVSEPQLKKGYWDVYEHWVVNAPKRLAVPRGPLSALPADGNPDMFFLDRRDRLALTSCVKNELSAQLCTNYEGHNQRPQANDTVAFSGSTLGSKRVGYCKVHTAWYAKIRQQADMAKAAWSPFDSKDSQFNFDSKSMIPKPPLMESGGDEKADSSNNTAK